MRLADRVIELPEQTQQSLLAAETAAMDITVGIRPEHILCRDGGAFSGSVDVSEMMGSEIYLHASVEGKETVIRIALTDIPAQYQSGFISRGTSMGLEFPGKMLHLFDQRGHNLIK